MTYYFRIMKTQFIVLSTLFVLTTQCANQKNASEESSANSKNIQMKEYTLKTGENITSGENIIEFKGIIEDSRCPPDVNCIWEGVAVGEFVITGPSTRPITFQLASKNFTSRNYYNYYIFKGEKITLTHVGGLKKTESRTKGGDKVYDITIKVAKATPEEIANPTPSSSAIR